MANEYKSFYMKDLENLIDHVAVDAMAKPIMAGKKLDGDTMTLAEVSAWNSQVSWHNEGIREIANRLKEKLAEEDGDE